MQKSHRIRRSRRPARLEADDPDDVRLPTNCDLLTMWMPRDLVDRAGMRVLGDEGSILFRRQTLQVSSSFLRRPARDPKGRKEDVPQRDRCPAVRRCSRSRRAGPNRARTGSSRQSRSRGKRCTGTCRRRRPTVSPSSRRSTCEGSCSMSTNAPESERGKKRTHDARSRGPVLAGLPASGCHAI